MLELIGEPSLNTLEEHGVSEADQALSILSRVSREVQQNGIHANTETNFPLALDGEGRCLIPPNVLEIIPVGDGRDLVERGDYFYDRENQTFILKAPVRADIVWYLPFEELPSAARSYIAIKAARQFQVRVLGSSSVHEFTAQDEALARAEFRRQESRMLSTNMFSNPNIASVLRHRRRGVWR
jgi:DNA-binding transcriptional regulator/RsmH inhibitor MraZ